MSNYADTNNSILLKVIERFNHVVLLDYMTNENHYNFTTEAPIDTKLGRMVT